MHVLMLVVALLLQTSIAPTENVVSPPLGNCTVLGLTADPLDLVLAKQKAQRLWPDHWIVRTTEYGGKVPVLYEVGFWDERFGMGQARAEKIIGKAEGSLRQAWNDAQLNRCQHGLMVIP